jgi:hypothetical protein
LSTPWSVSPLSPQFFPHLSGVSLVGGLSFSCQPPRGSQACTEPSPILLLSPLGPTQPVCKSCSGLRVEVASELRDVQPGGNLSPWHQRLTPPRSQVQPLTCQRTSFPPSGCLNFNRSCARNPASAEALLIFSPYPPTSPVSPHLPHPLLLPSHLPSSPAHLTSLPLTCLSSCQAIRKGRSESPLGSGPLLLLHPCAGCNFILA